MKTTQKGAMEGLAKTMNKILLQMQNRGKNNLSQKLLISSPIEEAILKNSSWDSRGHNSCIYTVEDEWPLYAVLLLTGKALDDYSTIAEVAT